MSLLAVSFIILINYAIFTEFLQYNGIITIVVTITITINNFLQPTAMIVFIGMHILYESIFSVHSLR